MARILYVWLPVRKIYPVGPAYIASHVHRRLAHARQRILDLSLHATAERRGRLERELRAFQPEVVSFSWRDVQLFGPYEGDEAFQDAMRFYHVESAFTRLLAIPRLARYASALRGRFKENLAYVALASRIAPRATVMVGGPGFSIFAEEIIRALPEGVVGVVGEGEEAVLKAARGDDLSGERTVVRRGGQLVRREQLAPVDIASSPMDVAYVASIFPEYVHYRDESVGVQTKRGCPHRCAFCLYGYIEGRDVRCRNPDVIVDEMRQYHAQWGVRQFWLADSQFLPTSRFEPVCAETLERLERLGLDARWTGYVRTDLLTPRLAGLMVRTGVYDIELSLTSGSQRILDALGTGIDLEAVYRGARELDRAGYRGNVILNYALNVPGETPETLRETVASYRVLCAIFGTERVHPFLFFLGIQPHTPLEKKLLADGYFAKRPDYLNLNLWSARKMLHNPPPLDRIVTRACLPAWSARRDDAAPVLPLWTGRRNVGREIMANLERGLEELNA